MQIKNFDQFEKKAAVCAEALGAKVNGLENKRAIVLCGGTGCLSSNSAEIKAKFEALIKENGLEDKVTVNLAGCFGFCSQGPFVKIFPEDTLYRLVKVEDVEEIFREDIQGGKVVETIDFNGMSMEVEKWVPGDDSVKVLLYGLLTVAFIVAFIWTWRLQLKQCSICMDITAKGKKVKSGKDDLKSLLDDQFHKTLLSLPVVGILVFTVLPIIFMVLVAFTSYDAAHDGYSNLFTWVGWDHFNELFNFGEGGLGIAFGEILSWTLMWSFFATFSNYFLGMFVAMMINKKGIKLKKLWRTVLVLTIAIPQFVSLLYVSKLFDGSGIIGEFLGNIPFIKEYLTTNRYISLWDSPTVARVLVIVINIWVGIPYMMLQATGILMNIPADLYESARVDGASPWQQYIRVTLPYMLFVTGPALLTSFVSNLNNFNVIYLLSGGNPLNTAIGTPGGASVGHTDLLITWLFKMTLGSTDSKYYMASVVGILIFAVCAILSLIIYNVIPSTKNEEDFN